MLRMSEVLDDHRDGEGEDDDADDARNGRDYLSH